MCYRLVQALLLLLAVLSMVAVFVPWQHVLLLSEDAATRFLAAKILMLPIPVMCVLGAMWAGEHARRLRH